MRRDDYWEKSTIGALIVALIVLGIDGIWMLATDANRSGGVISVLAAMTAGIAWLGSWIRDHWH